MGKIKIVRPGLLTLVQDSGRHGYQQFGVPVSGVMDSLSYRLGNLLVGNPQTHAGLEVTMLGPEIEFLDQMVIAVTGGDLSPVVNKTAIPMWESVIVQKGDTLAFGVLKTGCRSYIAFSGGIDVPLIMGSRSTYTRGNIGGYKGRALRAGDVLGVAGPGYSPAKRRNKKVSKEYIPKYSGGIELRVTMGPQDDCFTPEGIKTFLSGLYTVTNQCDRMGYRLDGEKIRHLNGGDIISDGIAMGAVQVPGHGQPIIMLADRQTTGGYTKIANVVSADLPKIAQAKPGDKVRFTRVTAHQAGQLLREMENKISDIKKRCQAADRPENGGRPTRIVSTRFLKLKIDGRDFDVKVEEIG